MFESLNALSFKTTGCSLKFYFFEGIRIKLVFNCTNLSSTRTVQRLITSDHILRALGDIPSLDRVLGLLSELTWTCALLLSIEFPAPFLSQ